MCTGNAVLFDGSEKEPAKILAAVELCGTQKTLPSGSSTPPANAAEPG